MQGFAQLLTTEAYLVLMEYVSLRLYSDAYPCHGKRLNINVETQIPLELRLTGQNVFLFVSARNCYTPPHYDILRDIRSPG